jgi:DNA polymerase-3 subunit delta
MIIKTYELQKLKSINLNMFLLYGVNEGFKKQVTKEYFIKEFDGKVQKYEEMEVLNNYENFISGLLNKSFFDNKKLIIITRSSDKILKLVKELIEKNISDTKFLIDSDILEKRSKLRIFFEKEKNTICIPFYEDDEKTLAQIANNFLHEKNISISREILNLVIERCRGDRNNLYTELQKISSLMLSKKKINTEDIILLTNLAENYSVSELVDNCLSKNINKTNKILNENNFSSEECILILRTFLSKAKRLLSMSKEYQINENIDKTLASCKPPIFWKDKEIVKNQILKWKVNEIEKLLYSINDMELSVKKNSMSSLNITYDFILSVAQPNN